jgi:hypothetical protein
MDERITYEQLIGDKLQHLPVPDMQDAIWLRIKTELDNDMPEGDDGEGGNVPQAPKSPALLGWGLAVVVVALIAAFLLFKKAPKTKTNTKQADTVTQIMTPTVQSTSPPLPEVKTNNKTAPVVQQANGPVPNVAIDLPAAKQPGEPITVPGSKDSVQQMQPSIVNTAPAVKDTVAPVKKGKGLSGIKDEDYRIVPKGKKE